MSVVFVRPLPFTAASTSPSPLAGSVAFLSNDEAGLGWRYGLTAPFLIVDLGANPVAYDYVALFTMPLEAASEPYAYSDTVIYDGSMWFCIAPGTTQTPGAGNDWQHFDVIGSTSPTTPTTPTSSALAYMTAALSADVAMTNANTFYTGATVTLPSAGVWMITGQLSVARAATGATNYTGKLTLDSTVVSSSIMSYPSQNPHYLTMPLNGIVTATAANQVLTMSGASNGAGTVIKATPATNGTGLTKLTQVVAVKIA